MSLPTSARTPAVLAALDRGDESVVSTDPDIRFDPAALDRLRAHALPIAVGLYPEPGGRSLACRFLPGRYFRDPDR